MAASFNGSEMTLLDALAQNYATADAYHPQASGQTFRQQDNAMLPVAPSQPDWTGHTMYDEAGNPTYAGASGFNYQDNHAAGQDPSAWGGDGTDGGDGYWQE